MAIREFFAHSGPAEPPVGWQPIRDHLKEVAETARKFGAKFNSADIAYTAGLLHDIGKYSLDFQHKLAGVNITVDHSTAGASIAAQQQRFEPMGRLLAYVIAGHHAGLANGSGVGHPTPLEHRLSKERVASLPRFDDWSNELGPLLPSKLSPPPLKPYPVGGTAKERRGLSTALFARMLFSCLIDADRLDTEAFYLSHEGKKPSRGNWRPEILNSLKLQLDTYLAKIEKRALKTDVNVVRTEILAMARAKAQEPPGLFSLTVPTGGGKTFSSLAFALDHAVKHKLDRVIYVIPFTSIIEQTAQVFRKALGDEGLDCVIEHHSAYREPTEREREESDRQAGERARLATENWDAPIIVTTAVQFFESLFSNRPGQCRKLHNIAKSVVILDEAQTMPLALLRPCVATLDDLARNYATSVVICTATQPALLAERADGSEGFRGGFLNVREIAEKPGLKPANLYERLRRVTVKPPIELDDVGLVERLRQHDRVLCIVGTRAHARDLFQELKMVPGTYHLSARMCPAHRSNKLEVIKAALKDGPCRLIATTVIEAGVDVDFPFVYRLMAGLDSIAQAAGRCNREGERQPEESIVQLFEMKDRKSIAELRKYEEVAREILRHPDYAADPLSLQSIEAYFDHLYWRQEDRLDFSDNWPDGKASGFLSRMNEGVQRLDLPFSDVAQAFQMIKTAMEPVIAPFDDEARMAIDELRTVHSAGAIGRKLQPYMVNVPRAAFVDLRQRGRVELINEYRFKNQFAALTDEAQRQLYSDEVGLDWDDAAYRRSEDNIF